MGKKRRNIYTKADLEELLQEELAKRGLKVTRSQAWDIFKSCFYVAVELAKDRWLSLVGVGTFKVEDSQRSLKIGKPAKRLRFKASDVIVKALNSGRSLLMPELTLLELQEQQNVVGELVAAQAKPERVKKRSPELKEPEKIKEPEPKESEIKEPEIKEPESKEPEIKEPEKIKEPEIKEPEKIKEPEPKEPEIKEPEPKEPEKIKKEVGKEEDKKSKQEEPKKEEEKEVLDIEDLLEEDDEWLKDDDLF